MLRLAATFSLACTALGSPAVKGLDVVSDRGNDGDSGLEFVQTREIPLSQLKVDFNFKPPGAATEKQKQKKKKSRKDAPKIETPPPAVDPAQPSAAPVTEVVIDATLASPPVGAVSPAENSPPVAWPTEARGEPPEPAEPPPPPARPPTPPPVTLLRAGTILQLPAGVVPRSLALAPRRRAIIITDESTYPGPVSDAEGGLPWPLSLLWPPQPPPAVYAYVVGHKGDALATLPLATPGHAALPHGAAELEDGSVALTYYQAAIDNVELWSRDLTHRAPFHDLSLKPGVPFPVPASLAMRLTPGGALQDSRLLVPFTVGDRLGEEGSRVTALMLFDARGSRVEAFARRQFSRVKYPHQAAVFAPPGGGGQPFLVVAGLNRWAWVDGVYGPESRPPGEGEVPYSWVEVYRFSEDRGSRVFREEQAARWADAHPDEHQAGEQPTAWQLAHVDIGATLDIVRSYVFPFTCVWPLFALSPEGYLIAACHGGEEIQVFRLFGDDGAAAPRLGPPLLSATRPAGIRDIGAIVMDTAPGTSSFLVLDRGGAADAPEGAAAAAAARVVAFPWPPSEDDLQNLGMARKPRLVEGIRRLM